MNKAEILDRCILFGKAVNSSMVEIKSGKFFPRFDEYLYGRPLREISLSGWYDESGFVQVLGLDKKSSEKIERFSHMFDFDSRGYMKIKGVAREVIWIAPFNKVQCEHLELSHSVYIIFKPVQFI